MTHDEIVELIEAVSGPTPDGCIIELVNIAQVNVRLGDWTLGQKMTYYERIYERINYFAARL